MMNEHNTDSTGSSGHAGRVGWRAGLLVGALLTAPLLALFFLADALIGLPLVPVDVIDWAARNLPGNLLTAGIDAIVATNETLSLGRTDEVAKVIEQAMGVAVIFIAGVAAAGALYALLRRSPLSRAIPLGVVAGLALGVPLALMSVSTNFTARTPPIINTAYIVGAYIVWGAAAGWIYIDLARLHVAAKDDDAYAMSRRQFLVRLGGATATLTVIGAGVTTLFSSLDRASAPAPASTPVASAPPTPAPTPARPLSAAESVVRTPFDSNLQPAPGTRPEYTPLEDHYRIDISIRPPEIDGTTWAVPISGLVDNPLLLTLDDLRQNYESRDQVITMSCISNPIGGDLIGTTRWTGVSFRTILEQAGVRPEGRFARITAADGFDEYLSLQTAYDDERVMLCYEWDGQPLLQKHGFPLRIYIPDVYGMKMPKWITGIEIVANEGEGYWVRRGWSAVARVVTTSVVDTVAVNDTYEDEDGNRFVPVGGIAYTGARSVARVEVRVNGGEWEEAQLRTPLSETTWVIWRYDWAFAPGPHSFEVRCVDGFGVPQIEQMRGVRPDGATGIHRRNARL